VSLDRRQLGQTVLLVAACGLAADASFTHPFTLPADVVTGIALVAMLVTQAVVVISSRRHRRAPDRENEDVVSANVSNVSQAGVADKTGVDGQTGVDDQTGVLRRFGAWIAIFLAITCFELITFFQTPRRSHPTLSYLADDLTSSAAGKAVLFLAWLMLGWLLVKRVALSRSQAGS